MTVRTLFEVHPVASWAGAFSLLGIVITILSGAIQLGRRDSQLDQKVDKAVYERDVGQIKADIRVIKSAVCSKTPAACQQ